MFREPERTKVFETDCLEDSATNDGVVNMDVQKGSGENNNYGPLSSHLAAATTNANEVKMDVQKGYGDKDTSGTFPT